MKIAACFFGKFYGTNALGDTQSFEVPYQHFKLNVLTKDVDVFLHGWDDDESESEKLIKRLKPKSFILEKQKLFNHPYKHYNFINDGPQSTQIGLRNNYSKFYSLKQCLSKVDDSYDFILISRFDCVFYEKIDLFILFC
jgi:hypothetical protein